MKTPLLITMAGPRKAVDVANVSNFEAGLAFLGLVGRAMPGLSFGKLAELVDSRGGTMAGWLTNMTHAVGDLKDGIGDVLKDTFTTVGSGAGSAVRLVTDENVIDGASRLGTAYATSGGSEGVRGLLSSGGGGSAVDSLMDFISSLGASTKKVSTQSASMDGMNIPGGILPWAVGGVAILFLVTRRR